MSKFENPSNWLKSISGFKITNLMLQISYSQKEWLEWIKFLIHWLEVFGLHDCLGMEKSYGNWGHLYSKVYQLGLFSNTESIYIAAEKPEILKEWILNFLGYKNLGVLLQRQITRHTY